MQCYARDEEMVYLYIEIPLSRTKEEVEIYVKNVSNDLAEIFYKQKEARESARRFEEGSEVSGDRTYN